jgi:hypothetical protein
MDSVVLGLASSGCDSRTVLVFEQSLALEGCHWFHVCSFEARLHGCATWHSSREPAWVCHVAFLS